MPAREILKAIVFCHRIADDKDIMDKVICIPAQRCKYLEDELRKRAYEGEIDTVQIGRVYIEATVFTPYADEVDKFLSKVDEIRLHSSMDRATPSEGEDDGSTPSVASNFTGFDNVKDSFST